jgi:dienelactone hydrolase
MRKSAETIPAAGATLAGDLTVPRDASAIVLFAHGSGSSRLSPRNQFVARVLANAGIATLLMDLLTEAEEIEDEVSGSLRFDIELLAERLLAATDWLSTQPDTEDLTIAYFGASTGAAAALLAAAERPETVKAIVSRGGRPDMAGSALSRVRAPTLLIVGGEDKLVIDLNRGAFAELGCEKRLELVPGASHLFEEPGTLRQVAELARNWFEDRLPDGSGTKGRRRGSAARPTP